jgi:DNA-directed RNA polymerase subunit L
MQLHCIKALKNGNHELRRRMEKECSTPFSSICHKRKFRKGVCHYRTPPPSSDNDKLKVATVGQQIMKELSEAVSEKDKVMILTMMLLDLMQRNGC